jgi:hypothetical protein
MKIIALTSANQAAMAQVAKQLQATIKMRDAALSVLVGIQDAHEALAVYSLAGELWRIGEDDSHPELDTLIDCQIDDSAPLHMARHVDQALHRFLNKQGAA